MPPKSKKTSLAKSDQKEVEYNIGSSVRRAVLASELESKIQLSYKMAVAKKAKKKKIEEAKKAIKKKEKAEEKAVQKAA
eukprot:5366042-Ditylum_brightwellii.AAC.1